jgi:hypothetical protein
MAIVGLQLIPKPLIPYIDIEYENSYGNNNSAAKAASKAYSQKENNFIIINLNLDQLRRASMLIEFPINQINYKVISMAIYSKTKACKNTSTSKTIRIIRSRPS